VGPAGVDAHWKDPPQRSQRRPGSLLLNLALFVSAPWRLGVLALKPEGASVPGGYYSLGIPTDLFTPVFAIARTSGWTAHVLEQLADNRLIRPQSVYTGPTGLKVTPIEQR